MAKMFAGDRIAPVWVEAARSLLKEDGRTALNYVLEVATPDVVVPADILVYEAVDRCLHAFTKDLTLGTVASTIFPDRMYQKHGRPTFYAHYLMAIKRGKKRNSWGTYAWRMMERKDPRSDQSFNPLERIVRKLRSSRNGAEWKAVYELGVLQPEDLLATEDGGPWCELAIPEPGGLQNRNLPCLSHLSIKLLGGKIHLTAMYRAHHYATRALGNLVGLSRLQAFLAKESGFEIGSLTCVSSLAYLDTDAFGKVAATKKLFESFPE